MHSKISDTAMLLCAGFGTRMRPLTLTTPKPLLKVQGKTMLELALKKLGDTGCVKRVVINTHYLYEQIEDYAKSLDLTALGLKEIIISREEEILETGGGIVKALPYFNNKPFFAINADLPWIDNISVSNSLSRMIEIWDSETMDVLLLIMRTEKAMGFANTGDFFLIPREHKPHSELAFGELYRKNTEPPRPYVLISAQILKPELFTEPPAKVFSNNVIYNKAEEKHKLYGLEHFGTCYHIGTPQDLQKANELLETETKWNK